MTVRNYTQYLEQQIGRIECRLSRRVEHWCDLTYITADEVLSLQAADHHLRISNGISTHFRHTCTHGVGRVQAIYIERDVGGRAAEDAVHFPHDGLATDRFIFVHSDNAHACVLSPDRIILAKTASSQPDLDRALWINQPLFDAPPKGRSMVDSGPQQFLECVGMGIELNHSYRSIARKHAQDGQRDGVIASDSDRSGSRVPDPLKVILNQTDAT